MPRALTLALLAVALLPGSARAATSLVEVPVDGAAGLAALERTGLDVTHDVEAGAAQVVLHDAGDAETLRRAGFNARTVVEDMEAATARAARSQPLGRTNLPSKRPHSYRVLRDYELELADLAEENPGVARKLTLGKSVEGRDIVGVEIAKDVNVEDDGRPVFTIYGLHHAREWPGAEIAMEFAYDLATGYGVNPEITEILDDVRVIIVPIVNPDGFVQSRGTDPVAPAGPYEFKRKNCANTDGDGVCADTDGVDLNRNYAAGWGGSNTGFGGRPEPDDQTYRGPAPLSEPEARAVHALAQSRQMTGVQSLHTFGAQILRPPGFEDKGPIAPDEPGLKALGDAMAGATLYSSEYGYDLYSVYGAAEDWNYASQGSYGYTVEISPRNGTNFHGSYQSYVVDQYLGADGTGEMEGMRWALLLAADQAADEVDHGVLTGEAAPGTKLRLRRDFRTETFCKGGPPACDAASGALYELDDFVETSLTVPASGRFIWHVGPSTRPWVGQAGGSEAWTFTCYRADGSLLAQRAVAVGRGESVNVTGCEPPKEEKPPVRITDETTVVEQAPGTPQGAGSGSRVVPRATPAMPKLSAGTVAVRRSSLRRRRSIAVPMQVTGGVLNALAARVRDSRGRLLGQRSFSRLDGRLTLRVRLRRLPRAGIYRVTVTGMTAGGILLRATARLVVR